MSVEDADGDRPADFETGRYLYCVVAVGDGDDADGESAASGDALAFDADGVEGESVYAIRADGLAALVHETDSLYDADDITRVREWLLDHQSVVDEAGEAFGTPLPFRFDTVVTGDDEAVREWLRDASDDLHAHLADLAGHWEYRVEVARTDDPEFEDDRLDELAAEIEAADEGRAFLLEKQRDRRRTELRRAADDDVAADARERLRPLAWEFEENDAADEHVAASFSLLAHEDDEGAIGEQLDAVAARDGIEVRFTGPWPPYSFAPEL
ncbi:GvpL/GvpF family gas vesicle protein [Halorussus vallis]|uniref:gas vesicle protein GvpL n=2 Tax=Halorussus TaxID=1070314 RepID=UPI0020A20BE8|nr:GvpL/GvpF family gas vesicle protein [Halorussus vallis]USZ76707.1 GvpL/GvpF family gas vesicle protein [Halorussus vallis]